MRRFVVGFAAMALVALLLGVLALGLLRTTLRQSERLVDEYLTSLDLVQRAETDNNAAARKARDYLLTRDEQHLEALERARGRFLQVLSALEARSDGDARAQGLVAEVRADWVAAGKAANDAMTARRTRERLDAALERSIGETVLPARARFDAALAKLVDHERAQVAAAQRSADAAARRAWLLLSAGFVVAMVAAALLGSVVARALRKSGRVEAQRRELEAQRAETLAQLQRTAEFRERFLGVVGHDLRSPLHAISLSAQVLLASDALRETERRNVRRIGTSVTRMSRMINELLDVTRIRLGGGMPVEPRQVDLGALCREIVDELQVAQDGANVTQELQGDPNGCWDPGRLGQVVANLVGNALQHSPRGTPVRVRIDGRAPGEVELTVANGGPPIPAALLPQLFEPFRRGRTQGGEGLGLGLYITQQIVRAHGGTLEASSSEREGTMFRVRIPRGVGECKPESATA